MATDKAELYCGRCGWLGSFFDCLYSKGGHPKCGCCGYHRLAGATKRGRPTTLKLTESEERDFPLSLFVRGMSAYKFKIRDGELRKLKADKQYEKDLAEMSECFRKPYERKKTKAIGIWLGSLPK